MKRLEWKAWAEGNVVDIIWKSQKYIEPVDRFIYTIFFKVKGILDFITRIIQFGFKKNLCPRSTGN